MLMADDSHELVRADGLERHDTSIAEAGSAREASRKLSRDWPGSHSWQISGKPPVTR